MARKKPPYMPLFIDDYEAATSHLTLEEDGAYMRLLRICWRQPGCAMPDDDEWIRRRLRIEENVYLGLVKPLIQEFFTRRHGKVFQKRLSREHDKTNALHSAYSEAGKRGARAKALKKRENDVSQDSKRLQATLDTDAQPGHHPSGNPASEKSQPGISIPTHKDTTYPLDTPYPVQSPEKQVFPTTGHSPAETGFGSGELPGIPPALKPVATDPPNAIAEALETIDFRKVAWDQGVKVITAQGGVREDVARRFIGRCLKDHEPEEFVRALRLTLRSQTRDPVPYIRAVLAKRQRDPAPPAETASAGSQAPKLPLRKKKAACAKEPPVRMFDEDVENGLSGGPLTDAQEKERKKHIEAVKRDPRNSVQYQTFGYFTEAQIKKFTEKQKEFLKSVGAL